MLASFWDVPSFSLTRFQDDDKKKRWAALGSAIFAAVALVVVFSVALTRKEKDDVDVDRHVNNAKSKLQDVKNKIVSQLQK